MFFQVLRDIVKHLPLQYGGNQSIIRKKEARKMKAECRENNEKRSQMIMGVLFVAVIAVLSVFAAIN